MSVDSLRIKWYTTDNKEKAFSDWNVRRLVQVISCNNVHWISNAQTKFGPQKKYTL